MNNSTLSKYINEYNKLNKEYKELEKKLQELKANIIEGMDNRIEYTTSDNITAKIFDKTREYIDKAIILEKYPAIYEEAKKTTSYRELRIK